MSGKHTPGPWDYGVIRDVLGFQPEWEDASDDRLDADARLITAAPDLLAALEALVISHRALCDSPSWDEQDEAEQEQARAIIAKAKGVI